MAAYELIDQHQLAAFDDLLRRHGWQASDFELEEDVFDPAKAEVEAARGVVGVRCLKTNAVAAYRIGSGTDWLDAFEDDVREGRMGSGHGEVKRS